MTKRDRSWGDRPRRTGLPRALGRFFWNCRFLGTRPLRGAARRRRQERVPRGRSAVASRLVRSVDLLSQSRRRPRCWRAVGDWSGEVQEVA